MQHISSEWIYIFCPICILLGLIVDLVDFVCAFRTYVCCATWFRWFVLLVSIFWRISALSRRQVIYVEYFGIAILYSGAIFAQVVLYCWCVPWKLCAASKAARRDSAVDLDLSIGASGRYGA